MSDIRLWDILSILAQVVFYLAVVYVMLHVIYGFGGLAPGDYPWEDAFPRPVANAFYYIANAFEMWRDLLAYS